MMYVAPLYTMPWSRWLVNAELNAYRMWGRTFSITDIRRQNKNLTMAAVIVNNARDFAYHFLGAKRRREKSEVFGGSFAHVYVIPNDHNGIRFLNWLMLIDDDAIQKEMTPSTGISKVVIIAKLSRYDALKKARERFKCELQQNQEKLEAL